MFTNQTPAAKPCPQSPRADITTSAVLQFAVTVNHRA
jgi:hypothetical protein